MISLRICLLAAVLMALSVAVVNATPPGKDKLLSNSRDLNAPIDLKTDVDDATKKTVLVYYANETAPDVAEAKNYEKLLEWLGDSKNPTLKRIGESIHGDLEKFHKVVDQELATIKKHVAADSGGKSTSVAIFTNRLTRAGQFQVVEPGIDAVTVIPFAVPRLKGMVYSSNPLSHPVVFRLALAALTRQFDPEKYQFVLITKSHGSEVHVLTPRVGLDISDAEREPLLAQLEKDVANMPDSTIHAVLDPFKTDAMLDPFKTDAMLDPFKTDAMLGTDKSVTILDRAYSPEKVKSPNIGDSDAGRSPARHAQRLGVTKACYLASIVEISSATGARFPLLFAEACRSQFDDGVVQKLEAGEVNIGHLYTSDLKGLHYHTIDYDNVFERVHSGASLTTALHKELLTIYEQQKNERKKTETSRVVNPGDHDDRRAAKQDIARQKDTVAAADNSAPVSHDVAFDRFVNQKALADAWTDLNAAGMADGALQTLEAERVLRRPEPHLSAQLLFTLTMRLALEQHDPSSLDRLKKAATQANRPELVTALMIAQKTAGPSRAGKDVAPVTPQDTDVPTFAAYRAFLHDIQAARLCGDARALESITTDLEGVQQFTEPQRESLLAQIKDAAGEDAAGEADAATEVPDALNRLVSKSRGIKFQGLYTHYDSSEDESKDPFQLVIPTGPRPTPTGPQLGQQRAGQSTNGQMSYETRQAALQLLRNPNGIKPSFARPTPSQRRP